MNGACIKDEEPEEDIDVKPVILAEPPIFEDAPNHPIDVLEDEHDVPVENIPIVEATEVE